MLAFGMKAAADRLPLTKPLKKIEEGRSAFVEDLDAWRERMRTCNFQDKSGLECRDDMLHYYKLAMQAAEIFHGTGLNISFRWRDSFDRDQVAAGVDFSYEAVCALYNVAAATSFMATSEDRGTEEGIKKACATFQEAAGILDKVKELVKTGAFPDNTPDLSMTCLDALHFLMLAQAQKCFYEKAMRGGMKDAIVAKIAAECAGLYADASTKLASARLSGPQSVSWLDVVEWNKKLFDGMQHYYAASIHHEANEYGKELSRLTYACNRVGEAVIMCKKAPRDLQQQFLDAHTCCATKQAAAKKDNDLVYNEKVPPHETLPALVRKAMVKPCVASGVDLEVPPLPAAVARQPTPGEASAVAEVMTHLAMSEAQSAPPSRQPSATTPPPAAAAAEPPPPPSFDAAVGDSVQQLLAMGFPRDAATAALQQAQGNVEAATDILLSGTTVH